MSAPRLRVLLPSDVFPPRCGGAGWSAHALALALIERGHAVTAIVPRRTTKDQGRTTKGQEHNLGRSSFVVRPETEDVLGVPVVVTVRDHWPWDYFSTGLHGDCIPYGEQTWAALATDLVARLGPARGALALAAIPYMLAHVRRRRQALRQD